MSSRTKNKKDQVRSSGHNVVIKEHFEEIIETIEPSVQTTVSDTVSINCKIVDETENVTAVDSKIIAEHSGRLLVEIPESAELLYKLTEDNELEVSATKNYINEKRITVLEREVFELENETKSLNNVIKEKK